MALSEDLANMMRDQDEDDVEEETMTAQEVLREIQEAWMNEKLCPEVLPHKAELVEVMMEQIEQMEENVKALPPGDLRSVIHRQELERIRYLLGAYLRYRLAKIEKHSLYHLHNDRSHLSEQEQIYLKSYVTATLQHLKSMTDNVTGPLGLLNPQQLEIQPDLEAHIFARSKTSNQNIIIEDHAGNPEDEVTLTFGSQHILPYKAVRQLVKESKVVLF